MPKDASHDRFDFSIPPQQQLIALLLPAIQKARDTTSGDDFEPVFAAFEHHGRNVDFLLQASLDFADDEPATGVTVDASVRGGEGHVARTFDFDFENADGHQFAVAVEYLLIL